MVGIKLVEYGAVVVIDEVSDVEVDVTVVVVVVIMEV